MKKEKSPITQYRTKIVATLGPASSTEDVIRDLVIAGADVFRLNFSHGAHEDHAERYRTIRKVEEELGCPVGILADLQGPKLRVGTFRDGEITLEEGQPFRFDLDKTPGDKTRVCLPHQEIIDAASESTTLLLNDGRLRLTVTKTGPDFIETKVVNGGQLSDRKGVNVPDMELGIPALTEKDRKDLAFALELGVDFVALSFVQRPEDVLEARDIIGGKAWLVSKLEKPQAIKRLEAIMEASDAVMVARGDLGVELPPETVPLAQKRIVRLARQSGKPVIVATQMLESMITTPVPTRAEASDVATAVFDGADAVMLSAESAAGEYPREAVSMMNRIIGAVEQDESWRSLIQAGCPEPERYVADAIAGAAHQVAHTLNAAAIVAFTRSGPTALRIARERPGCTIFGITPTPETARRLALVWGVHPAISNPDTQKVTMESVVSAAIKIVSEHENIKPDDTLVIAAGMPFGVSGSTNTLRVVTIPRAAG
ncbi:pyruvate kinase [Acetobacter sp. AN02]|uniref:pyruvate kinase n=1 Tax=Acetobacter sp. AN02 TaxID=2894186 RepID=UPI0024341D0F|nr:pyruvate kinase [Acetobacter sp. AN02]MDG6093575.1 pyruvate kinase [Acetobacter sp. AN02]